MLCLFSCLFPFMINAGAPSDIAEGNNRFAFALFHQIQDGKTGNQIFSPFSISTAMAMVYAGARNETASQMRQTLVFDNTGKFHAGFGRLLGQLNDNSKGKISLNIANGLWAQQDFPFLDAYFETVKTNYGSVLKNVDFIDNSRREATRNEINAWVAKNTNDRIKNILRKSDLDGFTRMVLVNAIYFYGAWDKPFEKLLTKTKNFTQADGSRDSVPFMNQMGMFNYYEDEKIKALEMPYNENVASMIVILPNRADGMEACGKALDYTYFQEITGSLRSVNVSLSLPKFKMNFGMELNSTLSQMGMPLAFSQDSADFSGMTGKRDLYISKVIHQAFVEVDEKGTEAAAATAVTMSVMMSPRPVAPIIFNADHPFLFLIRDNTTGSILFMGKVMKP